MNPMLVAIEEAYYSLTVEEGGPFGAVVVQNGIIIARGHNQVLQFNDPTCHAEIQTIRKACAKLGRFDLSDCELYTTCEPCPMCLGAIHWAKLRKIYIGCTAEDAASIGFSDKFIYDVIRGLVPKSELQVQIEQINRDECYGPFAEWKSKVNKLDY